MQKVHGMLHVRWPEQRRWGLTEQVGFGILTPKWQCNVHALNFGLGWEKTGSGAVEDVWDGGDVVKVMSAKDPDKQWG